MTIQVGMVGKDGILIAGDTRWTNTPLLTNRSWAGGRYGFNSTKIKISHERGIVVSSAMDMQTADHVAEGIIHGLKDEDQENPIQAIEEIAAKVLRSAGEKREAHCLIAFTLPTPRLFLFQFAVVNGEWGPWCQQMETKAIAGDNVNSAIFWAERYYQRLPIEKLVPLAAHLIISAAKLNTGTISGLEIVLCTSSSIHCVSHDSIRTLEAKANEWDKSIGELILST